MQVSVLIVNYNTPELAANAIKSVLKQQNCQFEIIVVDNASSDHSVDYLASQFPQNIKLIASKENLGFGRANNLAFEAAKGEFIYLLNPDAELESEYGLANLLEFAKRNKQFGLMGTAIYEPKKNRWVKPRPLYPAQQHLKYTQTLDKLPGQWAWVLGASMLIPHKIYQQLHGFDSDFFLYGEETDFCLRIRKAGYAIGFCDSVKVKHVSGASEEKAVPRDTWIRKQQGFYLFCSKHYDPRDVMSIAQRQVRRLMFRRIILSLKRLFLKKKTDAKIQRLIASQEVAQAYLNSNAR